MNGTNFNHQEKSLSIEQVKALYFNEDAIVTQPQPVYRLDNGSLKFYYTFDFDEFKPKYYISLTTLLQKTMPTPKHLIDWIANNGLKESENKKNQRALYGTLMDIEFSNFLIKKECDLDTLKDRVYEYIIEKKADLSLLPEWTEELTKDLLSFNQWCIDYEVEPIAMQIMLVSDNLQLGNVLDLVCTMNAKCYSEATAQKDRKRVRAIVDYKSGKSGFYESHEIQLCAYREAWNENFPEYPIEMIANYSGKDWIKEPSYNFKDQTKTTAFEKLPYLIEIAKIDKLEPSRVVKIMGGKMGFKKSLNENLNTQNADEYIINIMRQRL